MFFQLIVTFNILQLTRLLMQALSQQFHLTDVLLIAHNEGVDAGFNLGEFWEAEVQLVVLLEEVLDLFGVSVGIDDDLLSIAGGLAGAILH